MVAARPTGAAVAGADLDRDQAELRFRELYRANFRPVQGYAVNRLGAADDVPDVVSEVFTIAWRRLADIPPPPADRFWLYGTARRVIARRYRSAGRLRNLLGRLAALAELKATDREALLLVHWEQLSYAEAAQVLGCSANAVGIRVHKAKARMRALLGEEAGGGRRVAVIGPNGATDGS